MKKYQQLFLAIVSIVSFACLLIYRHEYNKLRYVLEVLSFFGTPGMPATVSSPCTTTNNNFEKYTLKTMPTWQSIRDSLFLYSAFSEYVDHNLKIKVYAVGMLNASLDFKCYLWHDQGSKIQEAQFNFSILALKNQNSANFENANKNLSGAFIFQCHAKNNGLKVLGVTVSHQPVNETYQGFIPVISSKLTDPQKNSTGICIMPGQVSMFNESNFFEFIIFHSIIGINKYVVYDNVLFNRLSSNTLQNLKKNVEVIILPWNYPYSNEKKLMDIVAEQDCLSRFRGVFENIIILDWNKFLVPHYILNFSKIINELDIDKKSNKFLFSTQLFCLEYEDNENFNAWTPLIFRKTMYSLPKIDIQVPLYKPHIRSNQIYRVRRNMVSVHQYLNCQGLKLKTGSKNYKQNDTTVFNYQEFLKDVNTFNKKKNL